MKRTTIKLTLQVSYVFEDDRDYPDPEICQELLADIVDTAVADGRISGNEEFIVDDMTCRLDAIPEPFTTTPTGAGK